MLGLTFGCHHLEILSHFEERHWAHRLCNGPDSDTDKLCNYKIKVTVKGLEQGA